MAVSRDFIDNLNFEVVKQKYYNANKVNASLEQIKIALNELIDENETLKNSSDEVEAAQAEIGDVLLSSKQLAAATVNKANAEADKIVADARQEAFDIINDAEKIMSAAKEEANRIQEEAARIQEKSARIDEEIDRIREETAKIARSEASLAGFSDAQLDTIDDIISQLDELSVAHSTKILKLKQVLMKMVTEG